VDTFKEESGELLVGDDADPIDELVMANDNGLDLDDAGKESRPSSGYTEDE